MPILKFITVLFIFFTSTFSLTQTNTNLNAKIDIKMDDLESFSCTGIYPYRDLAAAWDKSTQEFYVRGFINADYQPLYIKNKTKENSPTKESVEPMLIRLAADQIRTKTPYSSPMGSVSFTVNDVSVHSATNKSPKWQAFLYLRLNQTTLMDTPEGAREKTEKEMDEFSNWLNDGKKDSVPPKEPRYTISKFSTILACAFKSVDVPAIINR